MVRSAEGRIGRIFVLRLEDGDTIPGCIEAFAEENNLRSAFCALLGGVGAGKVIAGPAEPDERPITPLFHMIENVHEALAVGTIFPAEDGRPRLHLHTALGRQGRTSTGCARAGIDVWQLCEVVLLEILGTHMRRTMDTETGFEVLTVD